MKNPYSETVMRDIFDHASADSPRESCGVIVVRRGRHHYVRCRNVAQGDNQFAIDADDYAYAEDYGDVVAIVHSHPGAPANPSQADLVGVEQTGLPWLIVGYPSLTWTLNKPSGYVAPLIGREFVHGVLDCYSLIRDYYRQELGIQLQDFARAEKWWEKGDDLYRKHFSDAGFLHIRDPELRPHDVLLMQVGAPVPNHGAIYLGDNLILHHFMNRISGRDVYGGYWHKSTVMVVRHRDLL